MKSFVIYNGARKIMISAPHASIHMRDGKVKYAEPMTGLIAERMQQCYDVSCIIKQNNVNDDPNFNAESEYREYLQSYIEEQRIGLLFDLHQLAPGREMDLCIGTGKDRNIRGRSDILEELIEEFEEALRWCVTVDDPFAACYEKTVSASTARKNRIPCFQLEFNSRIFQDKTKIDEICRALNKVCTYWEMNEHAGMADCKRICEE